MQYCLFYLRQFSQELIYLHIQMLVPFLVKLRFESVHTQLLQLLNYR
jgi:hypothetical protein